MNSLRNLTFSQVAQMPFNPDELPYPMNIEYIRRQNIGKINSFFDEIHYFGLINQHFQNLPHINHLPVKYICPRDNSLTTQILKLKAEQTYNAIENFINKGSDWEWNVFLLEIEIDKYVKHLPHIDLDHLWKYFPEDKIVLLNLKSNDERMASDNVTEEWLQLFDSREKSIYPIFNYIPDRYAQMIGNPEIIDIHNPEVYDPDREIISIRDRITNFILWLSPEKKLKILSQN